MVAGRGRGAARRVWLLAFLTALAVACGAPRAEVRPTEHATADLGAPAALPSERTPAGTVRTAYPDEPAGFLDLAGDDAVARDLLALWGLPLFRVDPSGQLAAGLVDGWQVASGGDGWTVELVLRPGRWSDGRPVTAGDVVATVQALRDGPRAVELSLLTDVRATGDHTVRLTFAEPYARWWAILDGVGVLPAHVLAASGLDAYSSEVPVAGGWFRLHERVPGLRTSFVANPGSPLGAPASERIDVSVVPRYEAALGMLRRGDVEVVLGYLALNPVERAQRVPDVRAAAPIGGTTVELSWRLDGPAGETTAAARRRAVAAAIDVSELVEGLLGPAGEAASSIVPGVRAPAGQIAGAAPADVGSVTAVLPRWAEAIAFTARALQRDVRSAGGEMQLVSEAAPDVVALARRSGDAALVARRRGPAPSLVGAVHDEGVAVAADAGGPGSDAFRDALARAAEDRLTQPLYRVGVAHAWAPTVRGMRPSAWPGLGFWDAAAWSVAGAEEP